MTKPAAARQPMRDIEAQDGDEEEAKREAERSMWTKIWQGVAGATIVFEILAVAWCFGFSDDCFYSGAIIVAALIGSVVSGVVVKYEFELQDTDSLRKVQNDLRHEVNDFAVENTKLAGSNERLESQLAPLKETEQKLAAIAKKNGSSVKKLQRLVKENQVTLDEMNDLVEADVVYQMIDAVLDSEKSEDGHFSDKEIRRLALRLNGLPAIEVNKENFMRKIEKQRSVNSVVALMRTLHDKTIPLDERVFTIAEDYDPSEDA